MKTTTKIFVALFATVVLIASTQVSIVAVGRQGEGHTAVVLRSESVSRLRFLDSTDAHCKNVRGFVTPYMCAGRLAVIISDQNLALIRLPYSQTLADLTTALWARD